MNSEECDQDVYEHGDSLGLFDMSKDQAEAYCIEQTQKNWEAS